MMLESQHQKKQFKTLLKIISNEAIFVKFNTKNKKHINSVNELLQRIVVKCKDDPALRPFIEEVFQVDVIDATKQLIKHLMREKQRSIQVQFSSEEKATKYSNPYFVLSICKIFLDECPDDLMKEDTLTLIIEQFLTMSYLLDGDPNLKIKVNEFILNLLEHVQKHYGKLSLRLKEQLQSMEKMKIIVNEYKFHPENLDHVY